MESDAAAAIDPIPGRSQTAEPRSYDSFLRWLNRYDPLPFFSALCVLVGVWLIAGDLGKEDWVAGKLWLILVTQAYELCLIAGVTLLVRADRLRTATVLGLLESFFLLDNVFNTQVMPHLEAFAWWTSSLWLALVVVKAEWLFRCLRLRIPRHLRIFLFVGATTVAFMPQILDDVMRTAGSLYLLVAQAGLSLLAGLAWRAFLDPEGIGSDLLTTAVVDLDPDGQGAERTHLTPEASRRVRRCGFGVLALWSLVILVHTISWWVVFDLHSSPLVTTLPFLAILVAARSEGLLWCSGAWFLLVSVVRPSHPPMEFLQFDWAVLCIASYLMVRQGMELRIPRLAVPGILGLAGCLSHIGTQGSRLALLFAFLALLGIALRFREPLAAAVVLVIAWVAIPKIAIGRMAWGVGALVAGFVTLAASVALQLRPGVTATDATTPDA